MASPKQLIILGTGGVKIGNRCLIGMGAVITRDVPERAVMVGNPARLLRKTHNSL